MLKRQDQPNLIKLVYLYPRSVNKYLYIIIYLYKNTIIKLFKSCVFLGFENPNLPRVAGVRQFPGMRRGRSTKWSSLLNSVWQTHPTLLFTIEDPHRASYHYNWAIPWPWLLKINFQKVSFWSIWFICLLALWNFWKHFSWKSKTKTTNRH